MKTLSRSLLLFCHAALALACKSGDPTEEFCQTVVSCDCNAPTYADVDACVTDMKSNFTDLQADAGRLGLTYDQGCADTLLTSFADIECRSYLEIEVRDLCVACAPIHGDRQRGESCSESEGWSDCARDLECRNGACVDPCKIYKAGETCVVVMGDFIDASGICDDGLYCDYEDTATCKPLQNAGGACPGFSGCNDGLYCGPDLKCAPAPKEGEACTFFCEAGFLCDGAVCVVGPGLGEPCADFGCGPGLECDVDERCAEAEALLCSFTDDEEPAGGAPPAG